MSTGRADESLQDWWETMKSVITYHSFLWATASLYDIPQPSQICCNFDILTHIYIKSACTCYPITKPPGMSLFYSCPQSEIENSIKGLCWRCSPYLKASLSATLWYWMGFFSLQNHITHPSTCLTLCPLHRLSPNPFPSLPPQGRVWLMGLGTPSRCSVPNSKV